MSGSVSRGKNDPSQSLQMMERPLMTPDELKSIPKGNFVVMKTGTHPMRTKLRLFLDWGIRFGEPYTVEEKAHRKVVYADKQMLEEKTSSASTRPALWWTKKPGRCWNQPPEEEPSYPRWQNRLKTPCAAAMCSKRKGGSHELLTTFIASPDELPHRARAVYLYLCDRAGKGKDCWPAVKRLPPTCSFPAVPLTRNP